MAQPTEYEPSISSLQSVSQSVLERETHPGNRENRGSPISPQTVGINTTSTQPLSPASAASAKKSRYSIALGLLNLGGGNNC